MNRKSHSQFISDVRSLYGDEYIILGRYVGNKKKIPVMHRICGHIFYPTPNNLLCRHKCFECNGPKKLTHEQFVEKIRDIFGDGEYDILSYYKDSHTKILVRHNRCGHIYPAVSYSMTQGHGCSWCNRLSYRERLISFFLDKISVRYVSQAIFPWTYPKKYRYDFYLPEFNLILEYNGEQHYRNVECFKESLENIQRRDRIKKELALKNGLDYMIIPFWYSDDEIKDIITKKFGGNE